MTADPAPAGARDGFRLALAGAGKMGGSMLRGWLDAGALAEPPVVVEPHPAAAIRALADTGRIRLLPEAPEASPVDVLVLAIKPQSLPEAASRLAPLAGPGTTVVSILAGKTVANLAAAFPAARGVVRAMPNLPASIGRGAIGAYAGPAVTEAARARVDGLLRLNGAVEWLGEEGLIDAVTALSGSGPAYLFHLCEAMAEAGAASGLPPEVAARLARATVTGAAALLAADERPPAALRTDVTSPGGTTAAALSVLTGPDGLAPLMRRAVEAARIRAGELSG